MGEDLLQRPWYTSVSHTPRGHCSLTLAVGLQQSCCSAPEGLSPASLKLYCSFTQCVQVCTVEARGQLSGAGSLLPPSARGSSSSTVAGPYTHRATSTAPVSPVLTVPGLALLPDAPLAGVAHLCLSQSAPRRRQSPHCPSESSQRPVSPAAASGAAAPAEAGLFGGQLFCHSLQVSASQRVVVGSPWGVLNTSKEPIPALPAGKRAGYP